MKKYIRECSPTVIYKDTLMTGEWDFLDKNIIKDKCICIHESVCSQIVDLLSNKHYEEAIVLIHNINKNELWETKVW